MGRTRPGCLVGSEDGCDRDTRARHGSLHRKRLVASSIPIAFIFILALAIRVQNLDAPGLALDREYRSALIARAYYFETAHSAPEWRQKIALASRQGQGVLEPPVMEYLVASLYLIIGGEDLRIARLVATAFWLVGGIPLLKIAKRVASLEAAMFSTAYYLFVPLGVMVSRSFQPDSLMIMMFLVSLLAILQYDEKPSLSRLIIASLISGLAIVIRPFVLFTLLSTFVALAVYREGSIGGSINSHSLVYGILSLLPLALFYGYHIFISGVLGWKVETSFLPQLLLRPGYWKDWLLTASGAVGHTALVTGLVGLPMLRKGMPQAVLIGLWLGYVVFCLVFTYHIRFAAYYHLQLIVIVSLSFGPVVSLVIKHLKLSSIRWYWWMPVAGGLVLALLLSIRQVRGRLAVPPPLESEEVAREIGRIVGHSAQTVYVAYQYGIPLEYYGELSGSYWPRSISDRDQALGIARTQSVTERLNDLGFSPEYFVITHFDEFTKQHLDLGDYLTSHCHLVAESDQYLVYGNCNQS